MLPSSPESLTEFDKMLLDACALLRPPEKLTVAEWADKYGVLSSEGSARPGKYYISNAEYQREPFVVLTPGGEFKTVVLVWGSQVGKTQLGLFFVAFHVHHDPAPILFVEPTEDLAKVIVKDRIDPMIRDTPELGPLFAKRTKGKTDLMHKPFPGGQISMGWANSPTQLASRPIRILVTDEEGRYDANKEGDPVDQARKRMATFPNRKHLRTSSPNLRRTCRITKAYEQSDKRRYYVPCPQCGHFQTLEFKNLHGTPDDCYYACEAAGCVITEDDKAAMIRAGEWRAENPGGGDGKTAGFQLSSLYSPLGYTWGEIMADYLKCQGIPDKLQVFTNTVLAEPWDEQAEGADLNEVAKHAEDYPCEAPAGVIVVTCGTDVQKDRIEATKIGWGEKSQAWVLQHRVFYGDTAIATQGAWHDFDAWRRLKVEHETGLLLPVACTFVDSGDGNRTQAVYEYCRMRASEKVFASKGSSQNGAALVSDAKRVGKTRTLLVMVGVSTAKDTLYARLQIADKDRPGYIHFPAALDSGCTPEYYKHLTSEALVTRHTRGGEVSRWEKLTARNEALDCAVYAFAAFIFTRAPLAHLARKLAEKAARYKAEGKRDWIARVAETTMALQSVLSTGSLPASASPQIPRKSRRKVHKRPGFGWIHGS